MTFAEALDDPALLARLFPRPEWDRWRTFARVLEGLPLAEDEAALFQECTGRTTPPTRPASECWVIAGRRSGKSRIAAALGLYAAAFTTHKLSPGEVGTVLVVAVDRQQAGVVFGYLKGLVREVPLLAQLVTNETADSIELRNRTRVEVRSGSFRSVRGVTLLAAILDEVAFYRDETSALPDVELLRALKPALATTGGLVIGCSSPWGRKGLLWSKFRQHYGNDSDVLIWRAPSRVMNPSIPESLVAEALAEDPAAAGAEWLGEFRADVESFLARETLDACTVPGRHELPPMAHVQYVAFIDAAGGSGQDSFTLAVAHGEGEGGQRVAVLDCIREHKPPFSPDAVVAEFAEVMSTYGLHASQADRFAGAWVTEAFARHGIGVEQSADAKSLIYSGVLPLLNSHRCELLDHQRMLAQFAGLERRTRAGGRDVIDHGPMAHDDLCNAVAGSLLLAATTHEGIVMASNLAKHPTYRNPAAPPDYETELRERDAAITRSLFALDDVGRW